MKLFNKNSVATFIAVFFVVLLVLYFFITSSYFLTTIALPYLSKQMKMNFTAEHVELSFFRSRLTLKNYELGCYKESPFLKGKYATCNFDFFQILKGNIKLNNIYIKNTLFQFVKDINGKWNSSGSQTSLIIEKQNLPVILDFYNNETDNCTVSFEFAHSQNQNISKIVLSNLSISSPHIKSSSTSKLNFNGKLNITSSKNIELLETNISNSLTADFDSYLVPDKINMSMIFDKLTSKFKHFNLSNRKIKLKAIVESKDYNNYTINELDVLELNSPDKAEFLKLSGNIKAVPFEVDFKKCSFKLFQNLFSHNDKKILSKILNLNETMIEYSGELNYADNNFDSSGNLFLKTIYFNKISTSTADAKLKYKTSISTIKDSVKIKGKTEFSIFPHDKTSKLNMVPLAAINFDITKNSQSVLVNYITYTLENKNSILMDLSAKGSFPIPLNSGKSKIDIASEKILVKEIIDIYTNVFQESYELNTDIDKDKDINKDIDIDIDIDIDTDNFLKDINLAAYVDLKKIYFGKHIESSIQSLITIQNNLLKVKPKIFSINNTQIDSDFQLSFDHEKNYPYSIDIEFKEFYTAPFFKTLGIDGYKQASSLIENFKVDFEGNNIPFAINTKNELKGYMNIEFKDISLPDEARQFSILKILFIPLEVFSAIGSFIPGGIVYKNVSSSVEKTSHIFNLSRSLNLDSGKIYIIADGSQITIKKADFIGNKANFVNTMKFSGNIKMNQELKIKSKTNISGLIIPLHISGTMTKPEANTTKFLLDFSTDNAMNILDPMNIYYIVEDVSTGVFSTVKGVVNTAFDW